MKSSERFSATGNKERSMALFGSLSERLNHIFSKLTKRGKLTELEIRAAMREVRVALLEADVNLRVAKQFIDGVLSE